MEKETRKIKMSELKKKFDTQSEEKQMYANLVDVMDQVVDWVRLCRRYHFAVLKDKRAMTQYRAGLSSLAQKSNSEIELGNAQRELLEYALKIGGGDDEQKRGEIAQAIQSEKKRGLGERESITSR